MRAITSNCLALVTLLVSANAATAQCVRTEDGRLLPVDGTTNDCFGTSLAMTSEFAFVGAPDHDGAGTNAGAVYVFEPGDPEWVQIQKIEAPDARPEDRFGFSLDVAGDLLIVGAVDASGNEDYSGAAYIYRRSQTAWAFEHKITANREVREAHFGWAVAIDDGHALVGTHEQELVFAFQFDGSAWSQTQRLDASTDDACFGSSLAIDLPYAIIGAYHNGNGDGAVHFWSFDGQWSQDRRFVADNNNDNLGRGVDIQGTVAIAGIPGYEVSNDDIGGAVVYRHDGGRWREEALLTAQDGSHYDQAGISVCLQGPVAVLGAETREVDREQEGAAFVFRYNQDRWIEVTELRSSDPAEYDHSGCAVAFCGSTALVGAEWDNDLGRDSGTVRRYEVPLLPFSATPEKVGEGDTVTTLCCGGLPHAPAMLLAVEVDGIHICERIALGTFGVRGRYKLNLTVPPGLEGLNVTLQVVGSLEPDKFAESERSVVRIR